MKEQSSLCSQSSLQIRAQSEHSELHTGVWKIKEVREFWEYFYGYPIDISIEFAKVGGPIAEEHRGRLTYFLKLISPQKDKNERD